MNEFWIFLGIPKYFSCNTDECVFLKAMSMSTFFYLRNVYVSYQGLILCERLRADGK